MTQALAKKVTFDEFIAWYPENSQRRYELHDGVIIEMAPPTGEHEQIVGFLVGEIDYRIQTFKTTLFHPQNDIH